MSFILDSLKRSDRSRQLNTVHELPEAYVEQSNKGRNAWMKMTAIVLALGLLATLAYQIFVRTYQPEPVVQSPNEADLIPLIEEPDDALIDPLAIDQLDVPPLEAPPPVETTVNVDSQQFEQLSEPALDQLEPRGSLASVVPQKKPVQVEIQSDTQDFIIEPVNAPEVSSRTQTDLSGYDNYRNVSGRLGISNLHLDILSYHAQPDRRKAYINMTSYQEGERLAEGPEVIEIVPSGVLLRHNGQDFLLTVN